MLAHAAVGFSMRIMIGVVGTGTWGTAMASALAQSAANRGESTPVLLWGRRPELIERLAQRREHPNLSSLQIHQQVQFSHNMHDLADASIIFWAVPTQHTAAMASLLVSILDEKPIVSLSKGLEQKTHRRISEVLGDISPRSPFAVLSGPSHAEEVVAGHPAGLVAAADDEALAERIQALLHEGNLRVYRGTDVAGVELAGALKNVIAIAAGIVDGLGHGDNVKATLVTRGLAEIRRLGRSFGADDLTFAGLAGIGDLLTTCYSAHSRNRGLGDAIGHGQSLDQYLARTGMVPEGAWTAQAVVELAAARGVDLPIASQVASVLWHGKPLPSAAEDLLNRSAMREDS